MNKFTPPLTPLSFPIVLLVILLVTVISSSVSASECFERDYGSVDNKSAKNENKSEREGESEYENENKRGLAQVIQCLTEELESFEKINQDLRVKVYELEQTVFEGFESNLSAQRLPKFKKVETNLSDEKSLNAVAVDSNNSSNSDVVDTNRVFKDNP